MRILFAGSPAIAVPAFEAIAALCANDKSFELAGLLTKADSLKGRNTGKNSGPEATDCALAALRLAQPKPILKPEKLDACVRGQTAALHADILVSFAYGKIFGPQFLTLFPLGGINVHPSLLPRFRGPAPIPAAILNRDSVTGITIQKLAAEMDSGDILVQEALPLNGQETTASLSLIMAQKAAQLLPDALRGIAGNTLQAIPQDHRAATYCRLIEKKDGCIDWNQSAAEIDAQIRAYNPWPLAYTRHGALELFIHTAEVFLGAGDHVNQEPGQVLGKDKDKGILIQTGDGILALTTLQYQTKKVLGWKDFLNGARNFIGTRLSSPTVTFD